MTTLKALPRGTWNDGNGWGVPGSHGLDGAMVRSPLIFFPLGDRKVTFTGVSVTTGCRWTVVFFAPAQNGHANFPLNFVTSQRLIEPTSFSGGLPGRLNNS